MITSRQKLLLEKIIEEHIESALPVSSKLIEKKYDFGVCPATIRGEMQELTELGFLYQPHTSAGRVPTDKGYRFFVDKLLKEGISRFDHVFEVEELLERERMDFFRFAASFSKLLADSSSVLATVHLFGEDFFWKEGWEELLRAPEFDEKEIVLEFTNFVKDIEEKIDSFDVDCHTKVYIGKENPFSKSEKFSVISKKCHLPKGDSLVSLIGPKRMAYDKNISLIDSFSKILEKF